MQVVPVVIGALGCVTKEFERWLENLNIEPEVGVMQKAALLGTARILRKVLEVRRRRKPVSPWSFVMIRLTEKTTAIRPASAELLKIKIIII